MQATDAFIGLGSNLDEPVEQLNRAIAALGRIPETRVHIVSSYYQSRPLGPQDQPDYINAVAHVVTGLSAEDLLKHLQQIEHQHGRVRSVHWGPRTLDLDLLLYGDQVINTPNLQVPHPEIHRRGFVLKPLSEIAPEVNITGHGSAQLLMQKMDASDVRRKPSS